MTIRPIQPDFPSRQRTWYAEKESMSMEALHVEDGLLLRAEEATRCMMERTGIPQQEQSWSAKS